MRILRKAITEALVLGALALAVALTTNAVRAKGSLTITKNYFDLGLSAGGHAAATPNTPGPEVDASPAEGAVAAADQQNSADESSGEESSGLPQHTFREIEFQEVQALLEDPGTEVGLNVFVDARSDDLFQDGRIPGARQFYPYEPDRYIDNVLDMAMGAMKVVVYCGGGDCIDSILACRELRDAGVPEDALRLYEGGWTEWTAEGGPVERD